MPLIKFLPPRAGEKILNFLCLEKSQTIPALIYLGYKNFVKFCQVDCYSKPAFFLEQEQSRKVNYPKAIVYFYGNTTGKSHQIEDNNVKTLRVSHE